jgi:hypothetical protein
MQYPFELEALFDPSSNRLDVMVSDRFDFFQIGDAHFDFGMLFRYRSLHRLFLCPILLPGLSFEVLLV